MSLYSSAFSPSFSSTQNQCWRKVRSDSAIEEEIYDRLRKENSVAFSPDNIAVNVEQGQVLLSGYAAGKWQRKLAEIIAAQVRGVTGVRDEIMLDDVVSAQVILDPRSRLLSHIAILIREQEAKRQKKEYISNEHIIPVRAIEAANRNHVWLKEGEYMRKYPAFHPSQYPLAPADWKPPFPYQPGTVRWAS